MRKSIAADLTHCIPSPNRKSLVFPRLRWAEGENSGAALVVDTTDKPAARREALRLHVEGRVRCLSDGVVA